jgi:biotin-(acetyl-CoA carboxylase) ligase
MSAVALITALEEHTTKRLGLGWVSDVYCEGQKIGTVGTEGMLDSFSSYEYIIISFSVRLDEVNFPARLGDLIKKVFESENTSISMIIAKDILEKFAALYPKRIKSPEKFMDVFKQKFILRGIKVKYNDSGKMRRCKILGVDSDDGTLIVECSGGVIKHIAMQRNVVMPEKIKLK